MRKYKRALLHGLLVTAFAIMPVGLFGGNAFGQGVEDPGIYQKGHHVEKAHGRMRFGVFHGRPYRYRPHYYYYPYRPYYYRHYNYPYRPHYYYRW